jgi:hypothetical protein
MRSFTTANFIVYFDSDGVTIANRENCSYSEARNLIEVDSICEDLFYSGELNRKERVKILSKSAEFFYG